MTKNQSRSSVYQRIRFPILSYIHYISKFIPFDYIPINEKICFFKIKKENHKKDYRLKIFTGNMISHRF